MEEWGPLNQGGSLLESPIILRVRGRSVNETFFEIGLPGGSILVPVVVGSVKSVYHVSLIFCIDFSSHISLQFSTTLVLDVCWFQISLLILQNFAVPCLRKDIPKSNS